MRVQEAIGVGVLVAMRSAMLPTAVNDYMAQHATMQGHDNFFAHLLTNKEFALFTKVMASGELVVDKLPITPNRTDPLPLLGRIGVAAALAATLSTSKDRFSSALIAGISAAVASHVLYQIRKRAVQQLPVSAMNAALVEDAVTITGSLLWCKAFHWEPIESS